MTLFRLGDFTFASGQKAKWKIECDDLTDDDLNCLTFLLVDRLPAFGGVEGVPRGGIPLAVKLERFATEGPLLIVDDVFTTGGSIERQRAGRSDVMGAVIFARTQVVPAWIMPLFVMPRTAISTPVGPSLSGTSAGRFPGR